VSRTALMIALIALALGPPLAATAASGPAKFDSKVTVSDFVENRAAGNAVSGVFLGKVTSSNDNCATDRKVKLYRKRAGKDKLLGDEFSDPTTGDWMIGGKDKAGTYYARVAKVEIPAGICRADRSKRFVIYEITP
jgi:hypothetical protein